MRVIAGALRGRRFQAPPGRTTRPTADRVRESLFDLLGPIPAGARVLDLFAGSGALGIEALSRGAASALFVEQDRAARATLRVNLEALGLSPRASILRGGAQDDDWARRGPFDRIFADPPYSTDWGARVVAAAHGVLSAGGVLALEHGAAESPPEAPEGLALWKTRRYGGTIVSLYERTSEESP